MTLLQLIGIHKKFSDERVILENADLTVKGGQVIGITGASGSGKTTLLSIAAGLDTPSKGEVYFNSSLLKAHSSPPKSIGFIFQQYNLIEDMTLLENVCLKGYIQSNKTTNEIRNEALKLLRTLDIEARSQTKASHLSGGEKQRCAIARALMCSPSLIIADEPTGNLDPFMSHVAFSLLVSLAKKQNTALIIATHDTSKIKFTDIAYTLEKKKLSVVQ